MRKLDIHFDSIADKLLSYVCSLYQPHERLPYPLQQGQKGSLLGTVFASLIAHMLGKEEQLPGKQAIGEAILSLRSPETGLFVDPCIEPVHLLNPKTHSALYVNLQTTYFCHSCLHALGIRADFRVPWLEPFLDEGKLEKWLDDLDWNNPWLVSNLDMFVGIFLLEWQAYRPDDQKIGTAINAYFKWHDEKQNQETGFWGNQGDLLNAMAGAYHIIVHYDFAGKHLNYRKEMIDATLSLVCRDGLFVYGGGGGSCEDMDAIDILTRLSMRSDYRKTDIQSVLLRAAGMISTGQCADGGFSWRVQPTLHHIVSSFRLGNKIALGIYHNLLFKLLHRSMYCSTHYYSSLSCYPFKLNEPDMWSSWFRPLALAFIAHRYPHAFATSCNWRMPDWPGLGYGPFNTP